MGILTDLTTRLASKATTSFSGAHSRVAKDYASFTTKCPYPDPQDGIAAVTELSKYVQTCIFYLAVVDALGQVAAKLQFLAAISQQKIASQWFRTGGHHHA